jgi:hypothetical protein
MRVESVIAELNELVRCGAIEKYAIGGAVGATFYLEPLATVDVDVFVVLHSVPGQLIIDPSPVFRVLAEHGFGMEGEYVVIDGWPVQFLSPPGPLGDEALEQARAVEVGGETTRVFSPEHLAALALQTGRSKDKARLLQFFEQEAIDLERFEEIVGRHRLKEQWMTFQTEFLRGEN